MGLLDELDQKNRRSRGLIRNLQTSNRQVHQQLPKAPWGTHWVTPQQKAREDRRNLRMILGLIIGVVSWIPAFTFGTIALVLTLPLGLIGTVLAANFALSYSHKEAKKHSWKAWREYKDYVLKLVRARKK